MLLGSTIIVKHNQRFIVQRRQTVTKIAFNPYACTWSAPTVVVVLAPAVASTDDMSFSRGFVSRRR